MTKTDRELLLDAAQCLDDCLVRIYPEEFKPTDHTGASIRFSRGGGTISRIANLADALRGIAMKGGAE